MSLRPETASYIRGQQYSDERRSVERSNALLGSQSPQCQIRQQPMPARAASSPSISTNTYQFGQFSPNPCPDSHSLPDEEVWFESHDTINHHHRVVPGYSSSEYIHESGLVIPIARTKPVARASASSTSSNSNRRQSPKSRMPPKRQSSVSGSTSTPNKKIPKTEPTNPAEFSESVKKKLQASTRTGQACDRCKVRKIRCDGLPGGCSPCVQNNTECQTTDRITGVATSRGYVQNLEYQTRVQSHRIQELEAKLISMGVEVKPPDYHIPDPPPPPQPLAWASSPTAPQAQMSVVKQRPRKSAPAFQQTKSDASTPRTQETNLFKALPVFRAGCQGENYLGVSSRNYQLSSIKGTALSVFNMEIDIADFASDDLDEPSAMPYQPEPELGLYNKSYRSMLQTSYNINPKLEKVDLPPRNEGLVYADWYFRVLNPYLPVLHRPTFMTLLTRMYDDPTFQPSAAETVMVHMLFAIMFFQYSARNSENTGQQSDLNTKSNLHYHYALGFFLALLVSHTLQDIQAMTLFCSHLRSFPKPGASWTISNTALTQAIEQGLHRSSKRWAKSADQYNPLEEEMRKRVFYAVLSIHILLSGKLGRPIAMRLEDFDIEMPEGVNDEFITATGIDRSRSSNCSYQIGLEAMKYQLLSLELYSTLYSVKRKASAYEETVLRLESKLKKWQSELAPQFQTDSSSNDQEGRVFSLYARTWYLEFQMLLRHPAISLSESTQFNEESLDICMDAAKSMLEVVKQLQKYKSLDTTWYSGAVYLMAITTTLFAAWERRSTATAADLAVLREDMEAWLDVMGEVGLLLGSGDRLKEAVRIVTDGTIGKLSHNLAATTRSNSTSTRKPSHSPDGSGKNRHASGKNSISGTGAGVTFDDSNGSNNKGANFLHPDTGMNDQHIPYQTPQGYAYPDPSPSAHTNPYQASEFADTAYSNGNGELNVSSLASVAAAATAAAAQPDAGYNNMFTSENPMVVFPPNYPGSTAWRQWTGSMAGNLEPQDADSASALMALGGRDLATPVSTHGGNPSIVREAPIPGQQLPPQMVQSQPWPLMIFDMGNTETGT